MAHQQTAIELSRKLFQQTATKKLYQEVYATQRDHAVIEIRYALQNAATNGWDEALIKRLLHAGFTPNYVESCICLVQVDEAQWFVDALCKEPPTTKRSINLEQLVRRHSWWEAHTAARHAVTLTNLAAESLDYGTALHAAVRSFARNLSFEEINTALDVMLDTPKSITGVELCDWWAVLELTFSHAALATPRSTSQRSGATPSRDLRPLASNAARVAHRARQLGVFWDDIVETWPWDIQSASAVGYEPFVDLFLHLAARRVDFAATHAEVAISTQRARDHRPDSTCGEFATLVAVYKELSSTQQELVHTLIRTTNLDAYEVCDLATKLSE